MTQELKGRTIAILACDGFEQAELMEPRRAFDEAGAKTVVLSTKPGRIQGFQHDKPGESVAVDMALEGADPARFDAVLLPGGVMNADQIRMSESARALVKAIDRAGKPIAVICHGAWLLASAGLVEGRTLTSWPSLQDDLRNAGAAWVDREVCVDANWVSSRKPADIPAFNVAAIELIANPDPERARSEADVRAGAWLEELPA